VAVELTIELTAEELHDIEQELALREFDYFVDVILPSIEAGASVQWFQRELIHELQDAGTSDQDTRLGFALPPGHAKTTYSLLFIAWMVARDPDIQIKYVTYNQDRASEVLDLYLKPIIECDEYVRLFGRRINPKRVVTDTKGGKENNKKTFGIVGGRGWVQACGFGGGITGGRCDLIVIDDPFKNHETANSPTHRNKIWNEYGASVKTRRRAGRPLRILMLFMRWHLDDLTGRCKQIERDDWRWVELEALKAQDNPNPDLEARDPRAVGEALWPAVASADLLQKEKLQRPEIFLCLWQNRPVPESGTLFDATWLYRHEVVPACPGRWIQSWDCRHGGKGAGSSYAVGQLWFIPDHEKVAYLADQVRGRWSPEETLEVFDKLQDDPIWRKTSARLIEEKADGVMLLSLRGRAYPGMLPIKPTADKEARARLVQPILRAGQVSIPTRAPWLADWLEEVVTFPGAANDDQVDATTQLLTYAFTPDHKDKTEAARSTWAAMMG